VRGKTNGESKRGQILYMCMQIERMKLVEIFLRSGGGMKEKGGGDKSN
jgi:hypothetical protein